MKSALEIANLIKTGGLSVATVVEEAIALSKKWNPKINAIVEDRFSAAMAEAENLDSKLASLDASDKEKLPVFYGVPFTCKEMIAVSGMKSTLGSIHRKDRVMNESASVFKKIKETSAILLGTTNVPEVGFWFESDNVIYGPSKNPFDQSRTSGGSSGGEAAIIASGASYFGLGSDIGGSIRTPAAFCGIFGHKPSENLIPLTGHYPLYQSNVADFSGKEFPFTVIGPMARSAWDLRTLFRILIGPDGIDPRVQQTSLANFDQAKIANIKFFFLPNPKVHGSTEVESDISESVENVQKYIENLGGETKELKKDLFLQAFDLWIARAMTIETKSFPQHLSNDGTISYSKEFVKLMLGKRTYTFPALLTAFLEEYAKDTSQQTYYLNQLQKLQSFLRDRLGKNGVLIMPIHPRVAPHLGSTVHRPFDFSLAAVVNALGFPATAVPVGKNNQGLPIGLQVIAPENQDELCLRVAEILENGFGGSPSPD